MQFAINLRLPTRISPFFLFLFFFFPLQQNSIPSYNQVLVAVATTSYNNLSVHSFQTSFFKSTLLINTPSRINSTTTITMLGKTLFACATFVVAAYSQIIAFTNPPANITAGQPITLTWAGGDNSVCLIRPEKPMSIY